MAWAMFCWGMVAKSSKRLTALKAAVALTPMVLTKDWVHSLPICTDDCCMADTKPNDTVLKNMRRSKTNHSFPKRSTEMCFLIYSRHMMALSISHRVVLMAAPAIPACRMMTKNRSPAMLRPAETARKISGEALSPIARKIEAR